MRVSACEVKERRLSSSHSRVEKKLSAEHVEHDGQA